MKLGMIGLGKMGFNLALNLLDQGHQVVGLDLDEKALQEAKKHNIEVVSSVDALIEALPKPTVIWVMVPAGDIVDQTLTDLATKDLGTDSIIIDGGNTHYQATLAHGEMLAAKGIRFLDIGTSGGVEGARHGACLMVGGDQSAFDYLEPVLTAIACPNGLLYTGRTGSGHYLKMVHNGVEYGMMQAIGEGFEVLDACEFDYDNQAVAKVWNHGSIIEGLLMKLAYEAFTDDPHLDDIVGKVDASGEGLWTVQSALDLKVPTPVIALSLMMRYRSKQDDTYAGKVVAALRNKFGGHSVHTKK